MNTQIPTENGIISIGTEHVSVINTYIYLSQCVLFKMNLLIYQVLGYHKEND